MADALAKLRDRKVKSALARLPTGRTCDGCDLCCTAVGVHELSKPAGVRCGHLDGAPGRSCTLYPTHPRSCREFYCVWRASDDILPAWARPADSGWVMVLGDTKVFPMVTTVHPDPDRPDAWDTPVNRRMFAALAYHWNCLIAIGGGAAATHIFAPVGGVFTKDSAPELFVNGGERVGAPDFLFHRDRRPPIEQVRGKRFNFRTAWK